MVGSHSYNQLSDDRGALCEMAATIGITTIGEKIVVVRLSSPTLENIDEFGARLEKLNHSEITLPFCLAFSSRLSAYWLSYRQSRRLVIAI